MVDYFNFLRDKNLITNNDAKIIKNNILNDFDLYEFAKKPLYHFKNSYISSLEKDVSKYFVKSSIIKKLNFVKNKFYSGDNYYRFQDKITSESKDFYQSIKDKTDDINLTKKESLESILFQMNEDHVDSKPEDYQKDFFKLFDDYKSFKLPSELDERIKNKRYFREKMLEFLSSIDYMFNDYNITHRDYIITDNKELERKVINTSKELEKINDDSEKLRSYLTLSKVMFLSYHVYKSLNSLECADSYLNKCYKFDGPKYLTEHVNNLMIKVSLIKGNMNHKISRTKASFY